MRTVECPCGVVLEGGDDAEHVQTNARAGAAHPN